MVIDSFEHSIINRKFAIPLKVSFLLFGQGERIVQYISIYMTVFQHFWSFILSLLHNCIIISLLWCLVYSMTFRTYFCFYATYRMTVWYEDKDEPFYTSPILAREDSTLSLPFLIRSISLYFNFPAS